MGSPFLIALHFLEDNFYKLLKCSFGMISFYRLTHCCQFSSLKNIVCPSASVCMVSWVSMCQEHLLSFIHRFFSPIVGEILTPPPPILHQRLIDAYAVD
jgi:hypothetical protein